MDKKQVRAHEVRTEEEDAEYRRYAAYKYSLNDYMRGYSGF